MMAPRSNGIGAAGSCALLLALACRGGDVADGNRHAAHAPEVSKATAPSQALARVSTNQVCTTLGTPRPAADGLFLMEEPKLRATLAGSRGHGIELAFRYLGATAQSATLRSGGERRQLGVELLARDTCNLVYVMWRIEPTSELVVSVKRNGAQSTHAECENRGYYRLQPALSSPVPELVSGAEHRLRAEIVRGTLSVHVDGSLAWRGALDAPALELSGRSGLRSDNARFEVLALHADAPDASARCNDTRD